ncbi:hypothetical protein ABCY62_02120 [Acetivibrio clariflavus]|uniref:hypothetical protein n=1 Tax=Acetivibrio clariflavus TaxID=288965 RepID=UPI0031F54C5E
MSKCINAWYLYAFVEDENETIDTDFDIGFNNLDEEYEYKLIFDYLGYGKDIYCVVAHLQGIRDPEGHQLFNKKSDHYSDHYIEKKFNIVYKGNSKVPEYIVKINHCSEVCALKDFIIGYCISPTININDLGNFVYERITSMEDIKIIEMYTRMFEKVIVRPKIYANYNLVIYSSEDIAKDIKLKLLDYSRCMKLELEM